MLSSFCKYLLQPLLRQHELLGLAECAAPLLHNSVKRKTLLSTPQFLVNRF